jgi:hypothetical protein
MPQPPQSLRATPVSKNYDFNTAENPFFVREAFTDQAILTLLAEIRNEMRRMNYKLAIAFEHDEIDEDIPTE